MLISLRNALPPLAPFDWEIKPLTVLVGANGSGKTKLLSGLYNYLRAGQIGQKPTYTTYTFETKPSVTSEEVVHRASEWAASKVTAIGIHSFHSEVEELVTQHAKNVRLPRRTSRPWQRALEKAVERTGLDLATAHANDIRRAVLPEDFFQESNEVSAATLAKRFALWEIQRRDAAQGISPPPPGDAPWIVFQEILKASGLRYRLTTPEKLSTIQPYQLTLTNEAGTTLDLDDLSSGERIIFNMGTWLFGADQGIGKPKLLLLDEPDAHLHPEMTQRFLSALETVLIKKHGVHVILSTHSPTTVALLEKEESLFALEPTTKGFTPQPVSRDRALGKLLVGVPSLRISRQNNRQVFVESEYDQEVYQLLQGCLQKHLAPEVSLHFIESGKAKDRTSGGCSRVRELVDRLSTAGNDTVRGLIDWDKHAAGGGRIVVLCESSRYAIENALLDPLGIAALLVREFLVAPTDLGLDANTTWLRFVADPSQWQEAVNSIAKKVRTAFPEKTSKLFDESPVAVEYVGGQRTNVPRWYLEVRGHDLEDAVLKAFPCLGKVTKQQDHFLLRELCRLVYQDAPGLLCIDILRAFQSLQQ